MERYLDDRLRIPDEIRSMTKDERRKRITKLEKEAAAAKEKQAKERISNVG